MSDWQEHIESIKMVASRGLTMHSSHSASFLLDQLGMGPSVHSNRFQGVVRVALVSSGKLASALQSDFEIFRVTPGFVQEKLERFLPDYLVIEEEVLMQAHWRRYIDTVGRPQGQLKALLESESSLISPVIVLSYKAPGISVQYGTVEILPNLSIQTAISNAEYVPSIFRLLQKLSKDGLPVVEGN